MAKCGVLEQLFEIDTRLQQMVFLGSGQDGSDDDSVGAEDTVTEFEDEDFVPGAVDAEGLRDIEQLKRNFISEWDVHMRARGKHGALKWDSTTRPDVKEVARFDVSWPGRPEHIVIIFYDRAARKSAVVCFEKIRPPASVSGKFQYPICVGGATDMVQLCVHYIEHGW